MKKHNFYAGPSILSEYTIKNTADAVLNFADTGLSLLEISHRSKPTSLISPKDILSPMMLIISTLPPTTRYTEQKCDLTQT